MSTPPMKGWKYVQLPPLHLYDSCLWPWWARWCRPLRQWYGKRYIFNRTYKWADPSSLK